MENVFNSQKYLSFIVVLLIISFMFIGLIPNVHAATTERVVLSTDAITLTGTGYVPLYIDESTPLTFQYFLDHPNYTLHIEPANKTTKWTFYANNESGRLYFGIYGSAAIDSEYVTELASSYGNVRSKMNSPLLFNNEDSSYSKNHTLWLEIEEIPVDPYKDILASVSTSSSLVVAIVLSVLGLFMDYPLLLLPCAVVLVGIGIGFYLKVKRV